MLSKGEISASINEKPTVDYIKVDSLKPRMRNVNVIVRIVSKGERREVTSKRDYTVHSIAEALVGDETGCVLLNLWDQQIDEFDENDVVEIRNGYTSLFRSFLRLNIGRYGTAEKVERDIGEVNEKNNLSEIRHEGYGYRSGATSRPYGRRYGRY